MASPPSHLQRDVDKHAARVVGQQVDVADVILGVALGVGHAEGRGRVGGGGWDGGGSRSPGWQSSPTHPTQTHANLYTYTQHAQTYTPPHIHAHTHDTQHTHTIIHTIHPPAVEVVRVDYLEHRLKDLGAASRHAVNHAPVALGWRKRCGEGRVRRRARAGWLLLMGPHNLRQGNLTRGTKPCQQPCPSPVPSRSPVPANP